MRRRITVAVKVTKEYSSEKAMRDFQNEMSIMSEVAHSNIVRLYGIVSEGEYDALLLFYTPALHVSEAGYSRSFTTTKF